MRIETEQDEGPAMVARCERVLVADWGAWCRFTGATPYALAESLHGLRYSGVDSGDGPETGTITTARVIDEDRYEIACEVVGADGQAAELNSEQLHAAAVELPLSHILDFDGRDRIRTMTSTGTRSARAAIHGDDAHTFALMSRFSTLALVGLMPAIAGPELAEAEAAAAVASETMRRLRDVASGAATAVVVPAAGGYRASVTISPTAGRPRAQLVDGTFADVSSALEAARVQAFTGFERYVDRHADPTTELRMVIVSSDSPDEPVTLDAGWPTAVFHGPEGQEPQWVVELDDGQAYLAVEMPVDSAPMGPLDWAIRPTQLITREDTAALEPAPWEQLPKDFRSALCDYLMSGAGVQLHPGVTDRQRGFGPPATPSAHPAQGVGLGL